MYNDSLIQLIAKFCKLGNTKQNKNIIYNNSDCKNKTEMNTEGLPPVLLSSGKRYSTSIPEGKLSQGSAS